MKPARIAGFSAALVVLLITLIGRLWYVQVVRGDDYVLQAKINRQRRTRLVPPRGQIVDVRGRLLVTNGARFSAFVVPANLPIKRAERAAEIEHIALFLNIAPKEISDALRDRTTSSSDPALVQTDLTEGQRARIAERQEEFPALIAQVEPVRHYLYGKLAAHVLGYTGPISLRDLQGGKFAYHQGADWVGQSGIERQYDELLSGADGGEFFEENAKGRRERTLRREQPTPGATLTLTIDLDVQRAAEAALAGRHGAVVAVDPRDGRIIAFASGPSFDLNLFSHRPLSQSVIDSNVTPGALNRAINAFPPGSVFKIATSFAGLEEGEITSNTWDLCNGGRKIGNRMFGCHSVHHSVDLCGALEGSCDVFFYDAGLRLGPDRIAKWANILGLGEKTGVDLPWENAGLIPTKAWKVRLAARIKGDPIWYPGNTANMSIGQGDVLTTPLQMAILAAAVGNGGTLYEPRLLQKATASDDSAHVLAEFKPTTKRQIKVDAGHLRLIQDGMHRVVYGKRGTSRSAQLAGITIAGKSGSAEKRGGLAHGPTYGWFTCYASKGAEPASIAVCVMLEPEGGQNYHGGADAAPVARKVIAAHFRTADSGGAGAGSIRD